MRTEKNVKKFLKKLSFNKDSFKPQYKKYYDEITSLIRNEKIKSKPQAENLYKKFLGRGKAVESAIQIIQNYKNDKTKTGKEKVSMAKP